MCCTCHIGYVIYHALQKWSRYIIETFSTLLALCEQTICRRKNPLTMGHQCVAFVCFSLNKLQNKRSNDRRLDPMNLMWRHRDTAVITWTSLSGRRQSNWPCISWKMKDSCAGAVTWPCFNIKIFQVYQLGPSTIARNTALARGRRTKQPEVGTDLPWRLAAHCWLHCIFGHSKHF